MFGSVLHTFEQALSYVQENPDRFWNALQLHVSMSAIALLLAFFIAFPLAIFISISPNRCQWAIGLFNGIRVIPSLAILAVFIPFLGTGIKPAILALMLLGLPPILIQSIHGLNSVKADVLESASGMGMNGQEIFLKISLPLAWPSILNGLHTATVEVLASATLAALIGGGGLGTFIVNGLSMYNVSLLVVGAVPIVLLVLIAELGFRNLERRNHHYQPC